MVVRGWQTDSMGTSVRSTELGRFLRSRRDRLTPSEVDLPGGTRRRVPGLRREELALIAGVSVDYIVRLEQGRARHPSPQLLTALARALRLTDIERDHLFRVAGAAVPSTAPSAPPTARARAARTGKAAGRAAPAARATATVGGGGAAAVRAAPAPPPPARRADLRPVR